MVMKNKPTVTVIGLSGQSLFFELERLPQTGETVLAKQVHEEPGGKGFNQAVALARLGASVNFITFVGRDAFGEKIFQTLKEAGVTSFVTQVKNQKTAIASILTSQDGQNSVIVNPGVSDCISGEMLLPYEEVIAHSDTLLMQLEYPLSFIKTGLMLAQKHNVKTVINPAPFNKEAIPYLNQAFLLTPNLGEAKMLFGVSSDASLDKLKERIKASKFSRLVITLGAEGALLYQNNTFRHFPALALKSEEVIDTTGAGDAFNGALAYKLALKNEIVEALAFAIVASGLSVTRKHCLDAFPNIEEVERVVKEYEKEVAKNGTEIYAHLS